MSRAAPALVLRSFRVPGSDERREVASARGQVVGSAGADALAIDLGGRVLVPGLVNALDVLDLSTFPPLGTPPFTSLYEWAATVEALADPGVRAALEVSLADRLFLGGVRNLLAGVTATVHHHPYHRSLGREDFPVRVQARYQFADSPGRTPALRRTYRSSDRRIPWFVRAAEGTDEGTRSELDALQTANVLRHNTVILHGTGLQAADGPRLAAAKACLVWCPETDRRLYGTTPPVPALRAAGVRVGLGSDSPAAGGRDALSNLAAARGERTVDDILDLATRGSAEVARLPVGGLEPGAAADFVALDDLERFLDGDRSAIALVVVAGRPLYGAVDLLAAATARGSDFVVDGARRRLAEPQGSRLRGLLRAHRAVSAVTWARGISPT